MPAGKIKINNNHKNDRAINATKLWAAQDSQLTIASESYSWTFCILINIFVALFNIYYVLRQLDLTYKYSLCAWFNISSPPYQTVFKVCVCARGVFFLLLLFFLQFCCYCLFVFCSNFIIILFHFHITRLLLLLATLLVFVGGVIFIRTNITVVVICLYGSFSFSYFQS